MARRSGKPGRTVSLFPFLSILACVIGTLTLLITALALGQMDNDTVASAERYQQVKDELEEEREDMEQLRREIAEVEAQANEVQRQLADARLELDRLQREKEKVFTEIEEEQPLKIEIPTIDAASQEKRLEELENELRQQVETKEKLVEELKKHGQPLEEAQVVIQPSGTGIDLEPTFVECTSAGIVIYEGDEPQRVRRGDLRTDENFLGLLDRVAEQEKATIIFLIRDGGLITYYAARDVANSRYARNGKLPVIGQGKIDLSHFAK